MTKAPTPERLSDLPPLERSLVAAWVVAKTVMPLLYLAAFAGVVLDAPIGGHIVVWAMFLYHGINYLAIGAMGRYSGDLELSKADMRWLVIGAGFLGLLVLGALLAPTGRAAIAVLVVGGLLGHLLCHLGAAMNAYRRTMARPWPTVAPIGYDDDDEW